MNSDKNVFGVIAAAVKALMYLLIDMFNMSSEGVAMANKAVVTARTRQAIDLDLSMRQYNKLAIMKAAKAQHEALVEVQNYIAGDPEKAKAIDANVKDLEAVVKATETELAMSRAQRRM